MSQIDEFVKTARTKNLSDQEITDKLLSNGWSREEVQKSLKKDSDTLVVPKPTDTKTEISKISMWDSFQHVLLFISLYILTISLVLATQFIINLYFPEQTNSYSYYANSIDYQATYFAGISASIIVSYPLFSIFFIITNKRKINYPEITLLKSRKILIYITLVLIFIVAISYIISIIYTLLNGNISLNFLLKFLSTGGILGAVFGYYLYDIRHDRKLE